MPLLQYPFGWPGPGSKVIYLVMYGGAYARLGVESEGHGWLDFKSEEVQCSFSWLLLGCLVFSVVGYLDKLWVHRTIRLAWR